MESTNVATKTESLNNHVLQSCSTRWVVIQVTTLLEDHRPSVIRTINIETAQLAHPFDTFSNILLAVGGDGGG